MVADAPRMESQTPVTLGLRSAAYRVQVDSPLAPGQFEEPSNVLMTKERRMIYSILLDASLRRITQRNTNTCLKPYLKAQLLICLFVAKGEGDNIGAIGSGDILASIDHVGHGRCTPRIVAAEGPQGFA
jgi:hypothetical protein